MKPILLDIPERFESERLMIRVPKPGEALFFRKPIWNLTHD
jgi:hypothetical protein